MTIMNSRHQIINAWAHQMALNLSNFNKIVILTSGPYYVTVEVFTCAMDMTADFDLTLHSLLFTRMIRKGFPAIFIRLFIYIYVN